MSSHNGLGATTFPVLALQNRSHYLVNTPCITTILNLDMPLVAHDWDQFLLMGQNKLEPLLPYAWWWKQTSFQGTVFEKAQEMDNVWNNSHLYLHKGEYSILHYICRYILIILITLYKHNLCSWTNHINSMKKVNGSSAYIILCPYHLRSNCRTPCAFETLWSLFILVKHWCHLVMLVSQMSLPTDQLHSPELFWKK